jgi:predicted Zn-dependent protease with MMP-like domain
MDLDRFERVARRFWDEIPDEYMEGIDGLVIHKEALPHPVQAGIHTLGMCLTESYPSDWMGPETSRSVVALYWGSFRKVAAEDPAFDWEQEIWETLTHELRHHLEWLAREDQLEAVDYAMDESFKRAAGEDFDPWYYQSGDPIAPGVYRVEYDVYLEQEWTPEALAAAGEVRFHWHGAEYAIPAPAELGDLHYVWINGVDTGLGWLQVVLVRKRGWWEKAKRALAREAMDLLESEAEAEPRSGS